MARNPKLILSSGSPRRKELLEGAGIDFSVDIANDFKEVLPDGIRPEEVPVYMAKGKSHGFHRKLNYDEVLLTADTIVIAEGKVLGKPHSYAQAKDMLQLLSGKSHEVRTSVVLRSLEKEVTFTDVTKVIFSSLSEEEINYYIERYKPFDKAGAYGIQEWIGYIGITSIEGSYFNVMGLPIQRVYEELKAFGIEVRH